MSEGQYIPKWAIYLISGSWAISSITLIPFLIWLTSSIFAHEAQLIVLRAQEPRIASLENKIIEHTSQISVLNATRLTGDSVRSLESRLDRLEVKLDGAKEDLNNLRKELGKSP